MQFEDVREQHQKNELQLRATLELSSLLAALMLLAGSVATTTSMVSPWRTISQTRCWELRRSKVSSTSKSQHMR
jgi:hypothetical protein